jgi:indolepyruvate ferredoxin oxidoreductase
MVDETIALLTPDTHDTAAELLELPDVIRGYEEIKLRNVVLYRKRSEALFKRLQRGSDSLTASPSTLSSS